MKVHMIMKKNVNRRGVINCEMIGLIESKFNQNSCDIERRLITFHSAVVSQFKTHLSKRGSGLKHVNKKKILTKIQTMQVPRY